MHTEIQRSLTIKKISLGMCFLLKYCNIIHLLTYNGEIMNAIYRAKARQALANNWKTMLIMMFTVALLNTILPELVYLMMVPSEALVIHESQFNNNQMIMLIDTLNVRIFSLVIQFVTAVFAMSFCWVSLDLIRGEKIDPNQLIGNVTISGGRLFKFTMLYQFYLILWTFLFIIPGVIKFFSYSLSPFILKDNPNMSPSEAITKSRELMDGHKADLFVLQLTFAGWGLLAGFVYALLNKVLVALSLNNIFVESLISIILLTVCLLPLHVYVRVTMAVFYEKIIADANITPNGRGNGENNHAQSINLNKTDNNGQGSIVL